MIFRMVFAEVDDDRQRHDSLGRQDQHRAHQRQEAVELAIGLIGGVSAALLFLAFAWLAAPFRALLYVLVFLIGALIGMEIPLVMRASR